MIPYVEYQGNENIFYIYKKKAQAPQERQRSKTDS